jgi:hypothetical protein
MSSSCPCRPMARTWWPDAIVALWLTSNKSPSSQCCTSGACRIQLTLSSTMWLPCLKMGSGSRSSTSGVCTYIVRRSSSWIRLVRCAQKRRTGGHTSMAHSISTSRVGARSSSTRMPMCTWVVVDQVVDNHVCHRVGDQRDQQDCCLVAELIVHHCPIEDQD